MLAKTLPFTLIEPENTLQVVEDILLAPTTWLALGLIGLGLVLWFIRTKLVKLTQALKPIIEAGLGFEWVNRQVTGLIKGTARLLQHTQTGQLNWNVAGILAGLVLILILLARGA